MFPVEIWEEILQHVDARNLVIFKRVSRTWGAIIDKILERPYVWYRQCLEDIPQKLWSSLLEHYVDEDIDCNDFHESRSNTLVWLRMYKSWRGWQRIVEKSLQIGNFEPLPQHRPLERIVCIATLGNIVAIGSSEGYIAFYDTASDKIFYRADHAEYLEDVQLLRKGELVMAASSSINDRIKFWNLSKKTEEKSLRCTGSLITGSFDYCYVMRNNRMAGYRLSERACGDLQLRTLSQADKIKFFRGTALDGYNFAAVGADGNQVMMYTEDSRNLLVTWKSMESNQVENVYNKPEIVIRYYRIFKPRVVVCIGVFGEIGFLIDGGHWKIYNLFGKFGAPVTTVLFHVAILALGLQSGVVHLFSIKYVESLQNLDFDTMESRKLILDTQPIISLNATEHDSAQYLVAASNRHVHFVKCNCDYAS